jgi:hypothetical protein
MEINRSNYEIWLIDWLDGNLSHLQIEELMLFLDENPDIKKESEDIISFSLQPSEDTYTGKNNLKKSTSDLEGSQFEYLCVAYLENDISASQEAELSEIINADPDKKKTFELIQKTRIIPTTLSYPYKNQLIKKTATQRIIRLSVWGLSTAASIALLVATYLLIPQKTEDNNNEVVASVASSSGNNNVTETSSQSKESRLPNESTNKKLKKAAPLQKNKPLLSVIQKNVPEITKPEAITDRKNDSITEIKGNEIININKIAVSAPGGISDRAINKSLVASLFNHPAPITEKEGSNVGRFLAKNFREIFLKDKSPADNPLKGYEIAEAGVTGLNKLLGWEMAFDKNNDENGELKSVYFSSKILKFNAPIKKSESLP